MTRILALVAILTVACTGDSDTDPAYVVSNTGFGDRAVYREVFLTGAYNTGLLFIDAASPPAGVPQLGWSSNVSWGIDASQFPPPATPPGLGLPDPGYTRYWRNVGAGGRNTDVALGFSHNAGGSNAAELQLVRSRSVSGPVPAFSRFFCQDYLAVSTCMPWNEALKYRHVTCFTESGDAIEPGDCLGWFPRNHWLLVDANKGAVHVSIAGWYFTWHTHEIHLRELAE